MKPDAGKMKTEFVFLALVIVGLTAMLLLRDRNRVTYELPQIPGVERVDVDRLEIQSPQGNVIIERREGKWKLRSSGYAADMSKLDSALDALVELKLTTMVSASKDYVRYGMGEDSAIQIKAFAGDREVRSLILGKVASTYRHTFLRLKDDERVFHAAGSLRNRFEFDSAGWRDKTVLAFTSDEISSLEVQSGELTAVFSRQAVPPENADKKDGKDMVPEESPASAWTTADGTQAKADIMADFLNSLASLSCESFIDGQKDVEDASIVLKVSLMGNKDYHLEIRSRKEGDKTSFIGTSSRVKQAFFLEEYTANNLISKAKELFNPEKTETR